jgi:predicted RNA-binding Zn-ribbon protein involved in translation (DUF1610 family)
MCDKFQCPECGHHEAYQDEDKKVRCKGCDEVLGPTRAFWSGRAMRDGSLNLEPCPFCGYEILTAEVSRRGQALESAGKAKDDQLGDWHLDDTYEVNLEEVICQRDGCQAVLYSEEIREQEIEPERMLTDHQKEGLLERAKRIAESSYTTLDWDFDDAIQGGIDDATDERRDADFHGDRSIAYEFLDSRRQEIAQHLEEVAEFPFTMETPLTGREIEIFKDPDTESGKNWRYVDE